MGITQLLHDVHPKHVYSYSPGRQGSIGNSMNVRARFRQSTPDMPWAFDPYWDTKKTVEILGNNIQDGSTTSYNTGAGPLRLNIGAWNGNRSLKHQYGMSFHDQPDMIDKSTVPVYEWQGDVSWKRKLAATTIAKRTGQLFLVKPRPYQATSATRGGNYPISTTIGGIEPAGGEIPIETEDYRNEIGAGATPQGTRKQQRLDRFVNQTRDQFHNMRLR